MLLTAKLTGVRRKVNMILKSTIFKNAASKVGLEQAEEEGAEKLFAILCEDKVF